MRPDYHRSPGSKPFSRGALYTILKNPAYIGKVHHNGQLHDGQHASILTQETWDEVQEKLARNRYDKQVRAQSKHPSLLAGLIYDDQGHRMSPTYTRRKNRHYTYYVSQAVLQYRDDEAGSAVRVPAGAIEAAVIQSIHDLLSDASRLLDLYQLYPLTADKLALLIDAGKRATGTWREMSTSEQIGALDEWLESVVVGRSELQVTLDLSKTYRQLMGEPLPAPTTDSEDIKSQISLNLPVKLKRAGIESKLVYPSGPATTVHNRSIKALQDALLKSLRWNEELVNGTVRTIGELIERDNLNARQVHRLRKLAFLAPDIIERIIAGDVPVSLTLDRLKKDFPLDWRAQREHFELSAASH